MFRKHFLMNSALVSLALSVFFAGSALSHVQENAFQNEGQIAQGDGDPDESLPDIIPGTAEEVLLDNSRLKLDERDQTAEDAVATITAEGDFVVPTYLLPVEPATDAADISDTLNDDEVHETIVTTTETITRELPVVTSVGSRLIPSGTQVISMPEQPNKRETIQITQTTQQELIQDVPVNVPPQPVIISDEQGVPVAVSVPAPVAPAPQAVPQAPQAVPQTPQAVPQTPQVLAEQAAPAPVATEGGTSDIAALRPERPGAVFGQSPEITAGRNLVASKKPLLLPLAPINEIKKDPIGTIELPKRHVIPSDYADKVVAAMEKNEPMSFVMPQEVKVSFYPNATEFSGQTVKWIKAFSLSVLSDPRLVVDIRISTHNPEIQEKRLALVKNVLMNNGLSTHQIQVTYVDRPADTLILRSIRKPEVIETVQGKGLKVKKAKKW